jgi:hypothetical protein
MKWKILIVLLILTLITAGCTEKSQESGSSKVAQGSAGAQSAQEISNSDAGVPIDSVVFSRTGALISLKEEANILQVKISSANNSTKSTSIGKTEKQLFAAFDWEPEVQYKFEVITDDGKTSSLEVYAPEKPALKEMYSIKLEDVTPGSIDKTTENVKGVTKFSPDSKYLAIGTNGGSLKLI